MDWASAAWPRPRCITRTLAIWVLEMVLPGAMARGSTWPEKRSTSTLALTPICFSADTIRWPLGSTCTTVAVITPEKSLLFSVVPLPENSLLPEPVAVARVSALLLRNGSADTPASTELLRLTLLVLFCTALTFSAMLIISVSPTMRARWFSNSGRYRSAWKMAPVTTGGSPTTGATASPTGIAALGCTRSTTGTCCIRSLKPAQPPRRTTRPSRPRPAKRTPWNRLRRAIGVAPLRGSDAVATGVFIVARASAASGPRSAPPSNSSRRRAASGSWSPAPRPR